ncbi:MAG: gliding motility lipoprotein GldD [Lutibacter sp.]
MFKQFFFFILLAILVSCEQHNQPKPQGYLSLNYPNSTYIKTATNCPYSFEYAKLAKFKQEHNCWATITYPKLKATIYISYRTPKNNLKEILKEVEKLTFKHAIKADAISSTPYTNLKRRVFAKLYHVEGNAASNIQFSATDSLKHVLAGSLYFYVEPNYDSILPAVKYIEKDIKHLIETLKWKN